MASSLSYPRRARVILRRLVAQIPRHIEGSERAIRVISLKPPAANFRAEGSQAKTSPTAARCGAWLTWATKRSWLWGLRVTIRPPTARQREEIFRKAAGSVRGVRVTRHTASSKRVRQAAAMPERSEPAIGWAPTKRILGGSFCSRCWNN